MKKNLKSKKNRIFRQERFSTLQGENVIESDLERYRKVSCRVDEIVQCFSTWVPRNLYFLYPLKRYIDNKILSFYVPPCRNDNNFLEVLNLDKRLNNTETECRLPPSLCCSLNGKIRGEE